MTRILTIRSVPSNGQRLALSFLQQADRWAHEFAVEPDRNAHQSIVFLRSIEGTEFDDWPPSPPLQQISEHIVREQPAVLALGMAGCAHWSASFSAPPGGTPEWICDMACRASRSLDGDLGNRYSVSPEVTMKFNGQELVGRSESMLAVQLIIVPAAAGNAQTQIDLAGDRTIVLQPAVDRVWLNVPMRWQYRIGLRASFD